MTGNIISSIASNITRPLVNNLAAGIGEVINPGSGAGGSGGGGGNDPILDTTKALAVFSTEKLVDAYTGNALRLRRANDNAEQDFGYTAGGLLDTTSITAWQGNYNSTLPGDAETLYVGYALRRLRTSYSGPLVRVRRSSDDAELDIGQTNGLLDTAALLAHCGAGDGFVAKWYDQSGNNRDAEQIVLAEQPKLVNAGAVITASNGQPAIQYDGTNDYLACSNVSGINTAFHVYACVESSSSAEQRIISRRSDVGDFSAVNYYLTINNSNKPQLLLFDTANKAIAATGANTLTTGQPMILEGSFGGTRLRMHENGIETGNKYINTTIESTGSQATWLGRDSHTGVHYFHGNMQEVLVYYDDVIASRDTITSNINSAYGVYVYDAFVVRWYNQLDGSFYSQFYSQATTANQPPYVNGKVCFEGTQWLEGTDTSVTGKYTVVSKLDNTDTNATHTLWSNASGVAVQVRTISNVCGYRYDAGSGITQVTGGIASAGAQVLAWDLGISTASVGEIRRGGSAIASGLGYQETILSGASRLGDVLTGSEGFEGSVEMFAVLQQEETAAFEAGL